MLLAFHNKNALKTKTVEAMKADIKAERLVSGHYWKDKTGCFVGCVIRGADHGKFETELGIPHIIARLGDCLFEGLWKYAGPEAARTFAVDFLEAIPTGADLSLVWAKFAVYMLANKDNGVLQYAKTDATKKAIQDVVNLYQRMINGEKIDTAQWQKVRTAAYAAATFCTSYTAATAADAAATASAAFCSRSASAAAYSAYAATVATAAYTAATASTTADDDARSLRYTALATYLLQLFRECGQKKAA